MPQLISLTLRPMHLARVEEGLTTTHVRLKRGARSGHLNAAPAQEALLPPRRIPLVRELLFGCARGWGRGVCQHRREEANGGGSASPFLSLSPSDIARCIDAIATACSRSVRSRSCLSRCRKASSSSSAVHRAWPPRPCPRTEPEPASGMRGEERGRESALELCPSLKQATSSSHRNCTFRQCLGTIRTSWARATYVLHMTLIANECANTTPVCSIRWSPSWTKLPCCLIAETRRSSATPPASRGSG